MIKAIAFDCFGVLVGSGFWNFYRSVGGDTDKDSGFITETLNKADSGQITQTELASIMSAHLGISLDEYNTSFSQHNGVQQPMFDLIRHELKPRYKIGLISNAGPGLVEELMPPELMALFDSVIISAYVGLLKPDPAIYRLAAERLGVDPNEVIFVDDHADYLPGAQAAGLHTILFTGLDDLKLELASQLL